MAEHSLFEAVARCLLGGKRKDNVGVEGVIFVLLEAPCANWRIKVDGEVLVYLEAVFVD